MTKELLGQGGQGEVWLIPGDPPMVVKKALKTHDFASYLQELRTLKDLSHQNVVRYYDCPTNHPVVDRDEFLLFMEYCEHGSLLKVLKDQQLMYSVATIAKWATELFTALRFIKTMRLVHQDVKPDNLFVSGDDYIIKLGDFGIVRDLKIRSYRPGGTKGYMAPEALHPEIVEEPDAYKYDIYGAGWVVLDMINRSNPGVQVIDRIFEGRLPHLDTLQKLVIGCTRDQLKERFTVEEALVQCEEIRKKFAEYDVKPDPNPHRNRLMLPVGLDGQMIPAPNLQPSSVETNSFCRTHGHIEDGIESKPERPHNDRREVQLLELKEKLRSPTTFQNHELAYSSFYYKDDPTDPDYVLIPGLRMLRKDVRDFDKIRRHLCDQILEILTNLEIEGQYQCAENIEKYWKHGARIAEIRKTQPKLYAMYTELSGLDAWQQSESQDFGVQMLAETDRATLPHWDILQLLEQIIRNIEELGKLFIDRLIYRMVFLEGSRHAWFHLKDCGVFLRKDCTETLLHENRFNKTKLAYHYTEEMEHLNSEQIRRALIEAQTSFKRRLRNQSAQAKNERHLGPMHFTKLTLGRLTMSNWRSYDVDDLVGKLGAVPEQPFPGYVFLYGIPPAHKCQGGDCEVAGGFPRSADAEFRINYNKCLTSEQIDYIEAYVLLASALQYAMRCMRCELWLYELIVKLVSEIQAKARKWVFFFELTKLRNGAEALLFQFFLTNGRGSFITKDFQLVYSESMVSFLRFVPVLLDDLLPILIGMVDYYKEFDRTKGGQREEIDAEAHTRKMRGLIDEFWNKITTAESGISPNFGMCSIS